MSSITQLLRVLITPLLILMLFACASAEDERTIVKVADPMEHFARMIGGEWKMTAQSGTSMCDTWHWGPGRHSMRVVTEGEAADGSPWHALEVVYWHPGRRQVRRLSMHPFIPGIGRGVGEGATRFDGDTADAVFDLYQSRVPRRLRLHSIFEGPDKYHATLSEATGRDYYEYLAGWHYFRVKASSTKRPAIPETSRGLSQQLKALEPLVGHIWEAKGLGIAGNSFHIQSTFEYVPLAEYVYARTVALNDSGAPTHINDVYFFHHVGTGTLRCLALSEMGGVDEGDVTVLEDGSLQISVESYVDDQSTIQLARFDFEKDGTLRNRVWSLDGDNRALKQDIRYRMIIPETP